MLAASLEDPTVIAQARVGLVAAPDSSLGTALRSMYDTAYLTTLASEPMDPLTFAPLGDAAAACLSRAIARAVYEATPAKGDALPTYR